MVCWLLALEAAQGTWEVLNILCGVQKLPGKPSSPLCQGRQMMLCIVPLSSIWCSSSLTSCSCFYITMFIVRTSTWTERSLTAYFFLILCACLVNNSSIVNAHWAVFLKLIFLLFQKNVWVVIQNMDWGGDNECFTESWLLHTNATHGKGLIQWIIWNLFLCIF